MARFARIRSYEVAFRMQIVGGGRIRTHSHHGRSRQWPGPFAGRLHSLDGGRWRTRWQIVGQTDLLGYVATERPVSPHDFHATILHALGLDANRLTYKHHGRNEVPTVFGGEAIPEVFG